MKKIINLKNCVEVSLVEMLLFYILNVKKKRG